ncbi:hypothetical protein K040078D81_40390 [Blautia hominis]|uniref:Uncharacterized protein n=1 Tax=Blautia hominis TaxID=2025493 RepID=A0ABQ0BEP2_9FIRM
MEVKIKAAVSLERKVEKRLLNIFLNVFIMASDCCCIGNIIAKSGRNKNDLCKNGYDILKNR